MGLYLYTSWNLNPAEGTGVAVAMRHLSAALEAGASKFLFITENYRFGNFALFLLKRIYSNGKVALRFWLSRETCTLMGVDFDGCILPGRVRYILNLRSNFMRIKDQEKGWLYLVAWLEAFLQRLACKRAAIIVTATRETRQAVASDYGVPLEKIVVIPNGIDAFWKNLPVRSLPPEPRILSVASLYPRKGILYLLQALIILKKRNIPFYYTHVGGGLLFAELQEKVRAMGLSSQVEFTGPVSDRRVLANYYLQARIFCHPCLHEDFGNVLLEAMSAGCPVVAFDNSGARELIRPGWGILVEDRNIESLAAALERLLLDDALCEAMGRQGKEEVQRYSWEESALAFQSVLLASELPSAKPKR